MRFTQDAQKKELVAVEAETVRSWVLETPTTITREEAAGVLLLALVSPNATHPSAQPARDESSALASLAAKKEK